MNEPAAAVFEAAVASEIAPSIFPLCFYANLQRYPLRRRMSSPAMPCNRR